MGILSGLNPFGLIKGYFARKDAKRAQRRKDRIYRAQNPPEKFKANAQAWRNINKNAISAAAELSNLNDSIRDNRDAKDIALMERAAQLGLIDEDTLKNLISTAEQTDQTLTAALSKVQGGGEIFNNLRSSVPELVDSYTQSSREFIDKSKQLQANSEKYAQQYPEFFAQNEGVRKSLDDIGREQYDLVGSESEFVQREEQNLQSVQGLGSQLGQQYGAAQDLQSNNQGYAQKLVDSAQMRLKETEDKDREQLKDYLASQGLAESSAGIQAFKSLTQAQSATRNQVLGKIEQEVGQQEFNQALQAINLGSNITGQQIGLGGEVSRLNTGILAGRQGGLGAAANTEGLEAGTIAQGGNLARQGQEALADGRAYLDQQGNIIDKATGVAFQGIGVQQGLGESMIGAGDAEARIGLGIDQVSKENIGNAAGIQQGMVNRDADVSNAILVGGESDSARILDNLGRATGQDLAVTGQTGDSTSNLAYGAAVEDEKKSNRALGGLLSDSLSGDAFNSGIKKGAKKLGNLLGL